VTAPPTTPAEQHAPAFYAAQAATAADAATEIAGLWQGINLADIAVWWAQIREQVLAVIAAGQVRAAVTVDAYQQAILRDDGLTPLAPGRIDPLAFAGHNGDGVPLPDVVDAVPIWMKADIAAGTPPEEAAEKARYRAELLAKTEIQRSSSRAGFVGRTIEPRFKAWERYVNLPACGRCIVLAGTRYRSKEIMPRHPGCDCGWYEVTEAHDRGPAENEPSALFESMTPAQQDKAFTKAGAQAIRAGADVSQVVNARRGALGLLPPGARITDAEAATLRNGLKRGRLQATRINGRDVFTTTSGATVRSDFGKRMAAEGNATKIPGQRYRTSKVARLMPESIAEIAGDDQDMYLHLLRRFGYILDTSDVERQNAAAAAGRAAYAASRAARGLPPE
jgi:hypothetical protein